MRKKAVPWARQHPGSSPFQESGLIAKSPTPGPSAVAEPALDNPSHRTRRSLRGVRGCRFVPGSTATSLRHPVSDPIGSSFRKPVPIPFPPMRSEHSVSRRSGGGVASGAGELDES